MFNIPGSKIRPNIKFIFPLSLADATAAAASVVGGGSGGKQEDVNSDLDLGVLLSANKATTPCADLDAAAAATQQQPSNRFDVFQSLSGTTFPGSIATGASAKDLLPSQLGLKICKRGRSSRNSGNHPVSVPLPLSALHAAQICEIAAEPHPDANYCNVHSIDAALVTLNNPEWDEAIGQVLEKASIGLGLDYEKVTATLEEMLLLETGSSIMKSVGGGVADKRRLKEGIDRSIASLLIHPPSEYTGGNIRISYGGGAEAEEHRFDFASGSEAAFACQYLAYYADCAVEMDPIRSGHCIVLSYSLQYDMKDSCADPDATGMPIDVISKYIYMSPHAFLSEKSSRIFASRSALLMRNLLGTIGYESTRLIIWRFRSVFTRPIPSIFLVNFEIRMNEIEPSTHVIYL